jgi:hypothetical protein
MVGKISGFDEAAGGLVDVEVKTGEVFVGDGGTIDLDALVDADEVGRGIEGGAVAGSGQDAGEGGSGGAFAIGSRDEDGRKGGLRVAKSRRKDTHLGKVELAPGRGWRGGSEFVTQGVEMIDRCSVRHGVILGDGSGAGGR